MDQSEPDPVLPLRRYKRKKAVEDQIQVLRAVGSPDCRAYVRDPGKKLFPETLVWLFRAAWTRDPDLVEAVMDRLVGRAGQNGGFEQSIELVIWQGEDPRSQIQMEEYLVRCARRRGIAAGSDEMDEFRALVHRHILLKMMQDAEEMPFWEVNFSSALHYAVKDVFRKMKRDLDIPARLNPGAAPIDPDRLLYTGLSPDQIERRALAFKEAMFSLPERERIVLELLYMDPTAPKGKRTQKEVAEILGLTGRTVYNYLQRARSRLMNDPRLVEIRELEAIAEESDSRHWGGDAAETAHE